MAGFSQPASDESSDGSTEAPTTSTDNSILISYAAQLAHTLGNADAVRSQLPPSLAAAFDTAYAVQEMQGDDSARRLKMRTQDEVEKRRAAKNAYDQLVKEEEAAFRNAANTTGDILELLSSERLDEIPEPEFLIEGFLFRGSVAQLFGKPKSYKSFVMLDMAGCVGSGIPWQTKKVIQARVLYVVAEGTGGIKRRVRAWEELNKRPMTGVDFYAKAIQLGSRKEVEALVRTAKRGSYGLIIFDTQARCTVGIEENSNTDMGRVVAALDVLKEVTGACVALVHHSGADGTRARGATAILGAIDSQFKVEADKATMKVELSTTAQKDTGEHPAIEMDLVTPAPGLALAVKRRAPWYTPRAMDLPPLPQSELNALRALDTFLAAGATAPMLAKAQGGDPVATRQVLGQLHRKGCVKQKGSTWYVDRTGRTHLDGTLDSARDE